MEVGVRILGVVLRILNLLLAPLFWLRARDRRALTLPKPLLLRSATQHADAVRTGEITSEELVTAYIERVKEVNPLLNAVVDERFRAALEDAKEVDRRIEEARRSGKLEQLFAGRPLLGVPFTVKESCSLAGLSNAVGCLEFAGRRATADGAAVRLVKEAGAIPLLVSNTPELCLGWETTNLLRGTTNNPFCLDRTPGGSSGGEGALLAAGASAVSVSSDIAGSIRLPAAFCGVFGHKPTPGIIPIEGHIPTLGDSRFPQYLGVGPMARCADDLMLMMRVLTGAPARLRLAEPVDFSKLKVYYMTESTMSIAMLDVDSGIKDTIRSAAKYLQAECGASICEEKFKDLEDSVEMSVSEFFSMKDIPNLLQDPANPKRDKSIVVELIKYLFNGGTRSLQALGFTLIARHQLGIPAARRPHYRRQARRLKDLIESTLGTDGVFLYPVFTGAAHYHGQVYLRAAAVQYAMLANALGLPAAAVPRPRAPMPHALQVIAAPYQDRLCLAVAKQLEKAFGGWKPPGM